MRETGIEWTDHTWNPWWGCQRVSPGCERCYAEAFSKRVGGSPWAKGLHWGPDGKRTVASDKQWREPLKWNTAAEKAGKRARVFCASMADVFEDRPELVEPRSALFSLIAQTPWLDWQLLTKRPENMVRLAPAAWAKGWPSNVWAGTTVEDQKRADERIPELLRVPARVRFLSCEPLLGPVDLSNLCVGPGEYLSALYCEEGPEDAGPIGTGTVGWVIVGGESGPGARPFDVAWAREIVKACRAEGVPVFVKQLGPRPHEHTPADTRIYRLRDKKGGDPSEWPEDLRVREFPEVTRG